MISMVAAIMYVLRLYNRELNILTDTRYLFEVRFGCCDWLNFGELHGRKTLQVDVTLCVICGYINTLPLLGCSTHARGTKKRLENK